MISVVAKAGEANASAAAAAASGTSLFTDFTIKTLSISRGRTRSAHIRRFFAARQYGGIIPEQTGSAHH
jgi:hypothetical protein